MKIKSKYNKAANVYESQVCSKLLKKKTEVDAHFYTNLNVSHISHYIEVMYNSALWKC